MNLLRFTLVLILSLLLVGCNLTLAADITPPPGVQMPTEPEVQAQATTGPLYPIVAPEARKGQELYVDKCQPCHGNDGLGNGPQADQLPVPVPPIGTAEVARQSTPAEWYRIVSEGNIERFMPPFQSLSDRQRWDVVAYVYTLSAPAENLAEGQALYQANCESCHGPMGKGDGSLSANITMPDLSDQSAMAGRSLSDFYQVITSGASAGMPAFDQTLSDEQRWRLAEYVRSFTFVPSMQQAQELDAEQEPLQATPAVAELLEPTQVNDLGETEIQSETGNLGVVTGLVTNASGGAFPPGTEIELFGFDHVQVVISDTTTLDEDGTYRFEDIEMDLGVVFITTVDYQGVTYGSEVATVEQEGQTIDLPLQVYEATSEDSILQIDRIHLFFEFLDEQTLRVVELYIISNPGMKTIVAESEGDAVITFSLPEQASNLQFEDGALGERYISTSDGFGDTMPIRPGMGDYQILFSYEMPYERNLDLVRPVMLSTGAVVILVPEDGIKIKGESIQDAGIREVQGVPYHMYNGSSLAAGEQLRLTLSGRPSQALPSISNSSSTTLLVGLGAFGIVLIVAGIWLYRRSTLQADVDDVFDQETPSDEGADEEDADMIMDAILALDDLYQAGDLPEDAYVERRVQLKARLQELMDE